MSYASHLKDTCENLRAALKECEEVTKQNVRGRIYDAVVHLNNTPPIWYTEAEKEAWEKACRMVLQNILDT